MATGTDVTRPASASSLRLHTVDEAAEILRCGADYLYDLVRNRVVPCTRIGRRVLFTDDHLAAIVARGERKPVKR